MSKIIIDTPVRLETERAFRRSEILAGISAAIKNNPSEYDIELRLGMFVEMLFLNIDQTIETPIIDAIMDNSGMNKLEVYEYVADISLNQRRQLATVIAKQMTDLKNL